MPKLHSHRVKLVGVDGQEQAVIFDIEAEGVHLLTKNAQHLERFPFEVIVKWLPSTLRTQNPGTADCFDIQLKTPKGPRELRVKADSEKQSQKILKQLEATVQDLVDKRKAHAANQQKGKGASSNDISAQANKGVQPDTLQHAAPSDVFSLQPSLLVSGADVTYKRASGLTMVKGAKSSLGNARSPSDKDSTAISSDDVRQQHGLSPTSSAPSTLLSQGSFSGRDTSAFSPKQTGGPSPAELASSKQASLHPTSSLSKSGSGSMFAMSPRQRRDPSPAELAVARQSSLGTSPTAASKLGQAASARSGPMQTAHPSTAGVAAARQKSVGNSGAAAASDGMFLRLSRDTSPAELAAFKQSSIDSSASDNGQFSASMSAISPRHRRDPSPAELGLIRHQSGGMQSGNMAAQQGLAESSIRQNTSAAITTPRNEVELLPSETTNRPFNAQYGNAGGSPVEGPKAESGRQRRDSSPAQLAFSHQLPVSTQGGMLSQDHEEDVPRLQSFSGPSTSAELTAKATKQKKNKRDPSPLSRMGSSLLRPFTKGLSKLRNSRSSDKDGKLQAQSRTASQSDSLASRVTSASTLDSAGPSRFNSVSLQPQIQIQNVQGGKAAPGRSESFRFRSLGTAAPPDLAAEPSFAQDLPPNSRLSKHSLVSQTGDAAAASNKEAHDEAADAVTGTAGQSNVSSEQAGHSSDDDEFDYSFSQAGSWPQAGQRTGTTALSAAVAQPKMTSTSSAVPQSADNRGSKADNAAASSRRLEAHTVDKSGQAAASSAGVSRSSFVEADKFRPQLSRAERPQLAIATASVYSPLGIGAATSPTMRAGSEGGSGDDGFQHQQEVHAQSGSDTKSSVAAAGAAEKSARVEAGTVRQGTDSAQESSHAQPQGGSHVLGVPLATATKAPTADSREQASSSTDSQANQKASSQIANSTSSGAGAQDLHSLSDSASVSSASSSEFDVLDAAPYQSPVSNTVRSQVASPSHSQPEHQTVQRSGYSTSPILGPAPFQNRPAGDQNGFTSHTLDTEARQLRETEVASQPTSAAAVSQGPAAASPSQPPHEANAGKGHLPAQATLSSPRKGFSDKPILAVYSRRPSVDDEVLQESATSSARQQQVPDGGLQAKVHMLEEVVRQLSHDLKLAEAQQQAGSSSSHAGEEVAPAPKSSPATEREVKALSARVAELGGENEQLQWQLHSATSKLSQAEQTAQQPQHNQSTKPSSPSEQDSARFGQLQHQLEQLRGHNAKLQADLTAADHKLKEEKAQSVKKQKREQEMHDQAGHTAWELQHKVDNLTQENQSLLEHHEQLETRFESLTKQLAKAQHAQHSHHAAEAQSAAADAQHKSKTTALQEQVDRLMAGSAEHLEVRHRLENEVASLQRQLSHAESALSQQQHQARGHQQAEAATSGQVAVMQRQAESVAQENDVLGRQCKQQAADMKQLQSDVQARSAEVVSLSQEAAELIERLEAAEAAADRYEAKYRAAKGELQHTQAESAQQSAELEQLSESLSSEQSAARSSQQAVEELSTRLNTVQEELSTVTVRQQQLTVSESAAQQQVAALAEAYDKAGTACTAAEGEVHRLGMALQDCETQLLQAQQREGQVHACIRTAMGAAQKAAAARDKLLDQQAESQAELQALRAKVTRQAAAITAAADAEERVSNAEARCKAAHADSTSWQTQVAEMRAERERLLSDKASLHSQIAELREHYASLGLAPTAGAGHMGSLRASQEAESARCEAVSRLQSAQLSHERAAREWELEKQQLQASAHEQRKRLAEVESTAISHRAEAASLFRQAEASRQELAAAKQALSASRQSQGDMEGELRGHAIGVKAEADATVEAVRMQLAAATDKLKRSSEASERSLASKQAQLSQAQQALTALQDTSAAQSRESEQMRSKATEVADELRSLHADHARLAEQYEAAQSCNAGLHHDLKTYRRSLKQVSTQARALEQREEVLSQNKRDLNAQLDRAELEVSRADRQRQTAVDKCASLQKQCLSLQDMVSQQLPLQLEGKLHVHGGHRAKSSRADRIQAHLPGHELL